MVAIKRNVFSNISSSYFLKAITAVARRKQLRKYQLSIALVGVSEMRRLNHSYRKKNKPTDVLSFGYSREKDMVDGEIVICYPVAKRQAQSFKHSIKKEIGRLLVHGFLHILGYDHSRKVDAVQMFRLEDEILGKINF